MRMDSRLFISGYFKRNPLRALVPNKLLLMVYPSVSAHLYVQNSQTSQRTPKSKTNYTKEHGRVLPVIKSFERNSVGFIGVIS